PPQRRRISVEAPVDRQAQASGARLEAASRRERAAGSENMIVEASGSRVKTSLAISSEGSAGAEGPSFLVAAASSSLIGGASAAGAESSSGENSGLALFTRKGAAR